MALALGSNRGDRANHLRTARRAVEIVLSELHWSSVYETDPQYVTDQPPFLNACCAGGTELSPSDLLAAAKRIETEAGRDPRGRRFGPRTLDIDILLYGDRVIDQAGLRIPHPRMHERAFVLIPLAEIAPEWVVPGEGSAHEGADASISPAPDSSAPATAAPPAGSTVADLASRLPPESREGVRRVADAPDWWAS